MGNEELLGSGVEVDAAQIFYDPPTI